VWQTSAHSCLAGRADVVALQSEYNFRVQMLEIYNENLRDLLVDSRGGVNKLDILATQASGCNVPGATQVRYRVNFAECPLCSCNT
jgi:hypothetical protein